MKTNLPLLLISIILVFNSCRKDYDSIPSGSEHFVPTVQTTITGRVTDESGQPVSGVTASIGGYVAVTDAQGLYTMKNVTVPAKRCVVKFTHAAYIDQYSGVHPYLNDITYINPVIFPVEGTFSVSSATGGTVSLSDGSSAIFSADAFATDDGSAYNGTVTVKMNYINPDDNNFSRKIPGSDLMATDASGAEKILVTYGMLRVELSGASGEKLNLASGKTAQLTFPVSATQSSAPSTIPLWHFDETSGLWKEEGTATKSGNIYTATVSHFSWWNCDEPLNPAYIEGYVKTCNGTPVANAAIIFGGMNNNITTNSAGFYHGAAQANVGPEQIYAVDPSGTSTTQIVTVPNLTVNLIFAVPDLVFQDATTNVTISGTIADCDNFPVSALAVITSPQGYWASQLTGTNGQFAFTVPSGITYTITVSSNGLSNQFVVTPAATGLCDAFNVGLLPLCTTSAPGNFTFSIMTVQFGNQQFTVNTNHCSVGQFPPTTTTAINLTSIDANNYTSHYDMHCNNYIPGNYIWNTTTDQLIFTMMMNGIPVNVLSNGGSNGGNTLTVTPEAGGMVQASFDGPVNIFSTQLPGGQITGYITGSFTAFRNN